MHAILSVWLNIHASLVDYKPLKKYNHWETITLLMSKHVLTTLQQMNIEDDRKLLRIKIII